MAEDVGIIDFAIAEGSEQPVVDNSGTETEQPVVDNSGTETEQPVVEEEKDSEKVVDNSVKSEEKITTRKGEEPVEDKNTPKTLSEALKFLKTDPKHASAAKIFREDHFGREAYAKTFPTVQSAREAKAFIDAVGGAEGWESTQGIIQNIKQSDELETPRFGITL